MLKAHSIIQCLSIAGALGLFLLPACASRQSAVQPSTVTPTSGSVAPATAPVAHGGSLPAGASLMVRTIDTISTESVKPGGPFEATLASAIRDENGTELVPAGAKVFGQVTEAHRGSTTKSAHLEIRLTSIEAQGKSVPIATSVSGAEGGRGGAIRAAVQADNQVVIPQGTLIEFKLTQPAQLR